MTTNLTQIVDAISNKQFVAAQDMLSDAIQEKLSDSLIARKMRSLLILVRKSPTRKKTMKRFFKRQ